MGTSPGLFLNHTAGTKENYYSIGRMYNISPKEIAPFNNLQLEKGLSLNQVIKIPLTNANFIQTGNAAANEALVPVRHTVVGKEGLYRISVNYNKLPLQTLKEWNNIKGDAVSDGTSLIVGYLKVKKDLSPLAAMATTKPADKAPGNDYPVKTIAAKVEDKKVAAKEKDPPAKKIDKENVQPQVKVEKKEAPPKVEKKEAPEPVKETEPAIAPVTGKNFKGGFFKTDYDQQSRGNVSANETGYAAVFKSTSGWDDGKYYCLHNTALPGTIIKITSTSTGKSIYAKVLDTIPDIKQNTGILLRVSNAAAEALGVGENKFDCAINYSK